MVTRQVVPVGRLTRAVLEPVGDDADDLARRVAVAAHEGLQAVGHVADRVARVADALFGGRTGGSRGVGHFLFYFTGAGGGFCDDSGGWFGFV